jgi:hypothetical protein
MTHLHIITGHFYGIIYTFYFNGLLLLLITGITQALTVINPSDSGDYTPSIFEVGRQNLSWAYALAMRFGLWPNPDLRLGRVTHWI